MVSAAQPKPKRGHVARTAGAGSRRAGQDSGWTADQDWGTQERGEAGGLGTGVGFPALEPRTQLNSSAPDFTPGGLPLGGYGVAGIPYWDWQQAVQPSLPPLWREYADKDGQKYYYNSKTGLTQWERPPELDSHLVPTNPAVVGPVVGPAVGPSVGLAAGVERRETPSSGSRRDSGSVGRDGERAESRRAGSSIGSSIDAGGGSGRGGAATRSSRRRGARVDDAVAPKKKEGGEFGPPGCNLFVFHLPDDWTDDDLHEYFAPHGNVISAKVMKELGTGRSRGFGFVSYEDRVSAATAIKKMQGYKVLGKRLKVEFKKGEQEGGRAEADDRGGEPEEDDDTGRGRKGYPDDERLIGYLRAISAKNVVQSLKESEGESKARGGIPDNDDGD